MGHEEVAESMKKLVKKKRKRREENVRDLPIFSNIERLVLGQVGLVSYYRVEFWEVNYDGWPPVV